MEIKEIRELTPAELEETLAANRQKLFELNRKKAVGQLEHPEEIRVVRKTIAKLETVKRERALQIAR